MHATAAHPDDVSALDEPTALGFRDWASGARPVLGTIAASALLLLACSSFVIGVGGLGRRHDVGQRTRVQLRPAQTPPSETRAPAPTRAQTRNPRAEAGSKLHAQHVQAVRTTGVHQGPTESAPSPARGGDTAGAVPGGVLPATPVAPAQPPAPTTTTPPLPAPLDELPLPPPPAVPTVVVPPAPTLPPLPDVSTTTSIIGVP